MFSPTLLALITVHTIPVGLMLPGLGTACGTGPYGGYYDNVNKIVYSCEINNADIGKQMILDHEISHYIQDNLLTEKEWADYQKEWAKSVAKGSKQFLRDYGMTNAKEGFAEDAMYLQAGKYRSSKDAHTRKRINIVRKSLKRIDLSIKKNKME